MNNKALYILAGSVFGSFCLGFIAGTLVVKNHYEKSINDSQNTIEENINDDESIVDLKSETEKFEPFDKYVTPYAYIKPDLETLVSSIHDNTKITNEEESHEHKDIVKFHAESIPGITVIDEDDFGNEDDYSTEFWTYYKDGYLVNEYDEIIPISKYPQTVGFEWLNEDGYIKDSIIDIRNDNLKMYIEIAEDIKSFEDMYSELRYKNFDAE